MAKSELRLCDEKNPYTSKTPFEVLGVPRTATSREILEAYEELKEDINLAGHDEGTRLAKLKEIDGAMDALREAKVRASVEVFVFDDSLAEEGCRKVAEKYQTLSYDFGQMLERVEDTISAEPDVTDMERHFAPVELIESLTLQHGEHELEIDAKTEAMEALLFES